MKELKIRACTKIYYKLVPVHLSTSLLLLVGRATAGGRLNGVREVGDHAVGDVEEFTAGADKLVLVYSFTLEPCPCAACVREAEDQSSCSV